MAAPADTATATQALPASGLLRRVAFNAAALAVGGVVAQLCFVAIEALVARRLGRADYGVFSTVYGITLTSLYVYELGMSWKMIQDGARDSRRIPLLLGTTFVMKLALAAVVYAALLLTLPALGYDAAMVTFFAVFFFYGALLALQDSLAACNSVRLQMHLNALYQTGTPLMVLALVALAALFSPSLLAVGWAYVLGSLLITGVWTFRTFRAEHPRVDLSFAPQIVHGSYLYGASGLLYQLSFRVEVVALSLLRGMAEVGLFAAADKLADLCMKVVVLATRVTSPVLFSQSHHDRAAYARSCKMAVRVAAILGAGTGLVLALAAEPLLVALFGEQFRLSALVLLVLAPSVAMRFAIAGLQLVLTSSDRHFTRVGGLATGVAAATACNFALIPHFGVVGAALARLAGDTLNAAVLVLGARTLPVPRASVALWMGMPLLLSAASYAGAQVLAASFLPRFLLGLLSFGAALLLTGSIQPAELRELAALARHRHS